MNKKAIIISIAGKNLTKKEIKLIKLERPWGLILFKRNIESFIHLIPVYADDDEDGRG